jgi:hypothetical protein
MTQKTFTSASYRYQHCYLSRVQVIYEGGGRGGIRTHGGFNPTLDFESSALNRTQPPFRLSHARAIIAPIGAPHYQMRREVCKLWPGPPTTDTTGAKGTDFKPLWPWWALCKRFDNG